MNREALNTWTGVALAVRDAAEKERIVLTTHAKERMTERSIDLSDISQALRVGHVEPQGDDGRLSFASPAGEVIVTFNIQTMTAVVVTVMTPPAKRPLQHALRHYRKPRSPYDPRHAIARRSTLN